MNENTRPVYRGIPLYKNIIITTKDNRTIIGNFYKVILNDKEGDILRICYNNGELEHININDIVSMKAYIKEDRDAFGLGDIVEIDNVDNLNPSYTYSDVIGLQGKILVINKISSKNKVYYIVDLSIPKQYECMGIDIVTSGQLTFAEENLKLIKKKIDKVDSSRFFNPLDIKALNYKDLDGKILKMTVIDNDECLMVAGIDKETNTIYMLHSEVK